MNLEELGQLSMAAGELRSALCLPWDGEPEDDATQVLILEFVKRFYDKFSTTLTDDHLRVLTHLDGCRLCESSNLIRHVHKDITYVDHVIENILHQEFESRIDFLKSHGLISPAAGNKVCISHLGKSIIRVFRKYDQLPREKQTPREKVFIGSSTEGLPLARSLQSLLQNDLRCVIWNQGTVFGLGEATIESLENAVRQFDFGIFVLTPDDEIITRGTNKPVARDNVLFELGLFVGKLTRRRAFLVHPAKRAISVPTDLLGLTAATYDPDELPSNEKDPDEESLAIALGPVANAISASVRRIRLANGTGNCA